MSTQTARPPALTAPPEVQLPETRLRDGPRLQALADPLRPAAPPPVASRTTRPDDPLPAYHWLRGTEPSPPPTWPPEDQ